MNNKGAPIPTSHFLTSLRTRLHYLDWGNSSAPPLVLVHGAFDHAHSWDWTARELAKDYHVVVPDLRGHGDSAWSAGGGYVMESFVYDLTQVIRQLGRSPVLLVGHSLGGSIALRYAGMFPDTVAKIVALEGLGMAPRNVEERGQQPPPDRLREWIEQNQARAIKSPRRYPTIEAAVERMRERNDHLSAEQALHLTVHGVNRHEDGSYSWKFDPHLRSMTTQVGKDAELPEFWRRITCPALLCLGQDSWASNPAKDGRMAHFQNAQLVEFPDAGHWLHHDQFDRFIAELRTFLKPDGGKIASAPSSAA